MFLLVLSVGWLKMWSVLHRCRAWEASSSMVVAKQWKNGYIATKKYGGQDIVQNWTPGFVGFLWLSTDISFISSFLEKG